MYELTAFAGVMPVAIFSAVPTRGVRAARPRGEYSDPNGSSAPLTHKFHIRAG